MVVIIHCNEVHNGPVLPALPVLSLAASLPPPRGVLAVLAEDTSQSGLDCGAGRCAVIWLVNRCASAELASKA